MLRRDSGSEDDGPALSLVDSTGSWWDFQSICTKINAEPSYTGKTEMLAKFFKTYKGDVYLFCRLILAREDKRVYNLREKQMMKILSRAFNGPYSEMVADLEKGDMPGSAKKFWLQSGKAASRSTITLKQVNDFLDGLTKLTKEDDQTDHFKRFLPKCTGDDLKWICKVIDHDLKINIGAKFVLSALHPDAFEAYKNSNNLENIIKRVHSFQRKVDAAEESDEEERGGAAEKPKFEKVLALMTPVKPMLAK